MINNSIDLNKSFKKLMKNEHENFELRAEINKLRVENKILRDLCETTKAQLDAAKKMVDDLKPQVVEAMEACKKLIREAHNLKSMTED